MYTPRLILAGKSEALFPRNDEALAAGRRRTSLTKSRIPEHSGRTRKSDTNRRPSSCPAYQDKAARSGRHAILVGKNSTVTARPFRASRCMHLAQQLCDRGRIEVLQKTGKHTESVACSKSTSNGTFQESCVARATLAARAFISPLSSTAGTRSTREYFRARIGRAIANAIKRRAPQRCDHLPLLSASALTSFATPRERPLHRAMNGPLNPDRIVFLGGASVVNEARRP